MFEAAIGEIKKYGRIIIHRHTNPDGDAIGSQAGLKHIIKENFPEKEVYAVGDAAGRYAFIEDSAPDIIPDEYYKGALSVVLDTSAKALVSDGRYVLADKILRMDHHIFCEEIADVDIDEPSFESCCGLIAAFAKECNLKLSPVAANALYTGMVTDSGRFRFRSVTGETLRRAGALLDMGIDTDTLYAQLYLENFDYIEFKAYIYKRIKMTENGVAYIIVDKKMQEKFSLSREDASNVISFLDSIRGSIIWLAFIENDDGTIRVRLRSRFVTVNELAAKYHGGGHDCASGATAYSKKEMNSIISDADALIKEYKSTHEGWL